MPKRADTSDDEMMYQIQQGNQRAFRQLVEHHLNPLYRFAQRLLNDQMTAEDVVQETFIKVWYQAKQWQPGKAKLSTWLHTIVHNQCVDFYRKNDYKTVSLEEAENVADSTDHIHQIELSEYITHALQHLPERQRTAVLLCYYQGLSNHEAAELLNISIEALESLLTRGRKTLKQKLLSD